MIDEKSTEEVAEVVEETKVEAKTTETPASDPILEVLETEDKSEKSDEVDETKEEPVKTDDETPLEGEDSKEEKKEEGEPLDPKEIARIKYQERQKAKAEVDEDVKTVTEAYINEDGITEEEQRIRNVEARDYQRIVQTTTETLIDDYDRAIANPDLQMFNPDSAEYNQALSNKIMADYNEAYITYDENKNRVGIKYPLYKHLTETAELYKGAVKAGQFKQVRDGRKMRSNSDSKPAASPKEVQKDPIMEILSSD